MLERILVIHRAVSTMVLL